MSLIKAFPMEDDSAVRSIITPQSDNPIIREDISPAATTPSNRSISQQGELVLRDNITQEDVLNMKLQNLRHSSMSYVRAEAAAINMENETRFLGEVLRQSDDPEIVKNALMRIQKKQYENSAALEEEVIRSLEARSEAAQYLQENDMPALERMRERSQKNLILQNKMDELSSRSDFVDVGLNLLSEVSLVSGIQRTFGFGLTDYAEQIRNLSTKIEEASAEELPAILQETEELIRATQILGDNPEYVAGELRTILASGDEQGLAQFANMIDAVDTAIIGAGVFRAGRKLVKNGMVRASLDTESLNRLIEEANGELDAITDDLAEQGALSVGLGSETTENIFSSAAVKKQYEINQRILNETLQRMDNITFDDVEGITDLAALRQKLNEDYSTGTLALVKTRRDGGAEVFLQRPSGQSYSSEAAARGQITKKGLGDNAEVVEMGEGQFYIKVDMDNPNQILNAEDIEGVSPVRRLLGRVETWVNGDLHTFGTMTENTFNQIAMEGQRVYKRTLGRLLKDEMDEMLPIFQNQIEFAERGGASNRWFTETELRNIFRGTHGREMTEKQIIAFNGYRQLNDFQYHLDNSIMHNRASSRGFGSVAEDVFGVEINAKIQTQVPSDAKVFIEDSRSVVGLNQLQDDWLTQYDILEIDEISYGRLSQRMGYDELTQYPTNFILVPKSSVNVEPLKYRQLSYLAGGRIRYDHDSAFIKQVNVGEYEDGSKFRKSDKTHFTATNYTQAVREAEGINKINRILREGIDDINVRARAQRQLDETPVLGTTSLREYFKRIQDRGVDYNQDVVPLRNRETIQLNQRMLDEGYPSDLTMDEIAYQRLYSGRLDARGSERVPHVDPSNTQVLNPVAALNQNFLDSTSNAAFSAYREYTLSYLERYRPFLKVEKGAPRTSLLTAEVIEGLDTNQINKIRGEQIYARQIIGMKNADEIAALRRNEKLVEWALDRIPNSLVSPAKKENLISGLTETIGNPTGKLRSLVFNAKLGLFALPTMIVQMTHAPLIAFMSPIHGIPALASSPLLRIALLADDPQVIELIARKAGELELEGFGDLHKYISEFRHHGYQNFGANTIYEDAARADVLHQSASDKFIKSGRIFFEEGELIPRMTAYGTAVREFLSNVNNINPRKLDIDSREGRRYITERVNTLTLGMTRADIQQGLKGGLAGLAFQFQSYPMRAMDALFFSSKGLSKSERLRLGLGYLTLSGAAGLPLADKFADWYFNTFDQELEDPDWVYKTVYNGIIDGTLMASLGISTNYSSRIGLGAWFEEIVSTAATEPAALPEVILGPAGSTAGGVTKTLREYVSNWGNGYDPDTGRFWSSVAKDVAKQVSGFNNVYRAWVAYNTGMIYDSKGKAFIPMTDEAILAQIMGFPPQAYEDMGRIYSSEEGRRQIVDTTVSHMVALQRSFLDAETEEERESISIQIQHLKHIAAQNTILEEVMTRSNQTLFKDASFTNKARELMFQQNLGENYKLSPSVRREIKDD